MSKYTYNKDYFKVIDTEDKAYWLGFLYADGCVLERHRKSTKKLKSMMLELSLCNEDKTHLEKFVKCLDGNIPIKEKTVKLNGKEYKAVRINVCCTELCRDLCKLGCTPKKTLSLKLPNYDIVPKNLYRHFLRGLFDGDGCISIINQKQIIINLSGIEKTIYDFVDKLISCGVLRTFPTIRQDPRSHAVQLFIHGKDQIKDVLDYFYSDCTIYLDRKYNKYLDYYKDFDILKDVRGVHFDKYTNKYIATICNNGVRIQLGSFNNLNDAINIRRKAEVEKMNYKLAHLDSNVRGCSAELSEEALQSIG